MWKLCLFMLNCDYQAVVQFLGVLGVLEAWAHGLVLCLFMWNLCAVLFTENEVLL